MPMPVATLKMASAASPCLQRAWTTASVSTVHSGKQIRTNLLHKLGFKEPATPSFTPPHKRESSSRGGSSLASSSNWSSSSRVQLQALHREPLKDPPSTSCHPVVDTTNTSSIPADSQHNVFGALASIFEANSQVKTLGHPASSSSSSATIQITEPLHKEEEDDGSSNQRRRRRRHVTFNEVVSVALIPRHEDYSYRIKQCLWDSPEDQQANIVRNTLEFAADGCDPQQVREEAEHIVCPITGKLIHPIHVELLCASSDALFEEV